MVQISKYREMKHEIFQGNEWIGLKNTNNEPCLFTKRKNDEIMMVMLNVNDLFLASNGKARLEDIKGKLNEIFTIQDLGEQDNFLGMQITRYLWMKREISEK